MIPSYHIRARVLAPVQYPICELVLHQGYKYTLQYTARRHRHPRPPAPHPARAPPFAAHPSIDCFGTKLRRPPLDLQIQRARAQQHNNPGPRTASPPPPPPALPNPDMRLRATPIYARAVGASLRGRGSAATALEPLLRPAWARAPHHGRGVNVRAISVSVSVSADGGNAGGSTPAPTTPTAEGRRMASTAAGPSAGPSAGSSLGPSAGGRGATGRGMASVTTAPAGAAGPEGISKEEWAEQWRMAIRRFRQEEAALETGRGGAGAEKGRREAQ